MRLVLFCLFPFFLDPGGDLRLSDSFPACIWLLAIALQGHGGCGDGCHDTERPVLFLLVRARTVAAPASFPRRISLAQDILI